MQAEMYEIIPCPQGRLALMPRPRGGEWLKSELASLKARGVTDVVSLLQPAEEIDLRLQAEEQFCTELDLKFHRHPVKDHALPVQPAFNAFIDSLLPVLKSGGFIAIHCLAGIGRSATTAAALLLRLGLPASEVIMLISNARGFDVPETEEQLKFIHGLDEPSAPSP
jgi:protein-tyrosine phosphatase